jgi:hypothetical protein
LPVERFGFRTRLVRLRGRRDQRAFSPLETPVDVDIRTFRLRNTRYPTTLSEARPLVPDHPWGRRDRTTTPLTPPTGKDDVIRARHGSFLALAADV